MAVLIGDPGRTALPFAQLVLLAEYPVMDIGSRTESSPARGLVLTLPPNAP
ncbi:MAG: hypothetical protein NTX73_04015 [Rhodobacterales bacterium]|nr:hypothetical protein [Rhodobacterales bacterium]